MTESATPSPLLDDPVLMKLRGEEHGDSNRPLILIAVGIAITLAIVIALAVITYVFTWLMSDDPLLGLKGWLFLWLLPFIGAAYWIDRQTRGRYWADSWSGHQADQSDEAFIPAWKKYALLALIGPRLIVGGVQRLQKTSAVEHDKFLVRCNAFIRDLADYGEAAPVTAMIRLGDTPARIDRIIDYLDGRDWIGHNANRTKVWLSGDAKNNLIRWQVIDSALA
ncbi:MAG TPA: hypothetical protein VGB55_00455 [Tepidisphaeraceae bacterium]|jgi:hypothetical protein